MVDEIGAGALRMAQFGDLHPDSKLRLDDLQLGDRVFVDLLDGRRRNLLHLVAKLLVKFAPCYVVPRCLVLRVHASDVLYIELYSADKFSMHFQPFQEDRQNPVFACV